MEVMVQLTVHFIAMAACVMTHGLGADAATASQVGDLISSLQQNYSRQVRPPLDQSQPLIIDVGFRLNSIREFDEASEKFSCIGQLYLSWNDDRLTWSPGAHSGTGLISVDNDLFWTPSIYVPNSLETFERIADKPYWKVTYYYSGVGAYYSGDVFTTYCKVEVEKYPWDTQTCTMTFGIIGYGFYDVRLQPNANVKTTEHFTGDGTWELTETSYGQDKGNNYVHVTFTLKRKPHFVILNVMLPVILMFVLDLLVFLIPVESDGRVSYCLTVLLAIAVFLTLVADTMPKSATSIARFSYYLVSILVVCIVNTLLVILNLRVYFKHENDSVPKFIVYFIEAVQNLPNCHKKQKVNPLQEKQPPLPKIDARPEKKPLGLVDMDEYPTRGHLDAHRELDNASEITTNGYNCDNTRMPEAGRKHLVTWKEVSAFLDAVFFLLSLLTFCLLTGIYFISVT